MIGGRRTEFRDSFVNPAGESWDIPADNDKSRTASGTTPQECSHIPPSLVRPVTSGDAAARMRFCKIRPRLSSPPAVRKTQRLPGLEASFGPGSPPLLIPGAVVSPSCRITILCGTAKDTPPSRPIISDSFNRKSGTDPPTSTVAGQKGGTSCEL